MDEVTAGAPVVVVGGGIGGLATALALMRARREVIVLERSDISGEVGAGITLFPNALRALDAIGVGDAVRAVGAAARSAGVRDPRGRWLARTDRLNSPYDLYVFHRAHLHAALRDALPPGVLRTAVTVSDVGTDDSCAWVTLADGTTVTAPLVVGADGVRSAVRFRLWPDHPQPRYAGYTTWRAVTKEAVAQSLGILDGAGETWGRGQRFGMASLRDGRVYWYATATMPPRSRNIDPYSEVWGRFAEWHEPIPALLQATDPSSVVHHDVHTLDPPPASYLHGRVALLGDAAHAMTPDLGQGACQAIEDAVTLAAAIAGHGDAELPAALTLYDEQRRPRTANVVRTARLLARVAQARGNVATPLRTMLVRAAPASASLRTMQWISAWQPPQFRELATSEPPVTLEETLLSQDGLLDQDTVVLPEITTPTVQRYPLGLDMALVVLSEGDGTWTSGPGRLVGTPEPAPAPPPVDRRSTPRDMPTNGLANEGVWREAVEGDGAAQLLVDVLRHEAVPQAPGFRIVRVVPPPEATGERLIDVDQTNTSLVVGERVVVKWVRRLTDTDHPAPVTLSHLAAIGWRGVPTTHGMLVWTAPSGREVPCAIATGYLPRARDGWVWCVELVEEHLQRLGLPAAATTRSLPPPTPMTPPRGLPVVEDWAADFPARLGRLAAGLHLALATPSKILPEPVGRADPAAIRGWHAAARDRLAQAEEIARSGALPGAAPVVLPRVSALAAAIDTLDELAAGGASVQRVHGDLHAGQVLRWPGGLAVVDFDGNPILDVRDPRGGDPAVQPAARDVAQLLRSLDHVGRVADKRMGFTATTEIDAWSIEARRQLLEAYRTELAAVGRDELFDERLLVAFEAEQACREIIYSARFLPRWAYAPLGGLRIMNLPL